MKRDWINVWIDKRGDDTEGDFLVFSRAAVFRQGRGATVRIEETAQSGAVVIENYAEPIGPDVVVTELPATITPVGVSCYGDAEVYLAIRQGNSGRFLSAPLRTTIKLKDVVSLTLIVLAPLPRRLNSTHYIYRTNLNGHCIFSVGDSVDYEFQPQREGLSGSPYWATMLSTRQSECKID